MIASVVCACGHAAANVSHRTMEGRPVALFCARLVAVALKWAVDPTACGDRPVGGVCPICRALSRGAVYQEMPLAFLLIGPQI